MPQISVIIPHHEIPDYLERLLLSIPDNGSIETIVVDDGSVHQRAAYEELKRRTEGRNIIYIDCKDNRGAGAARNIGIENATGEWLIFADSDDTFTENAFENMMDSIYENSEQDIIFFAPTSAKEDGSKSYRHEAYAQLVMDYIDSRSAKNEIRLKFLYYSPCSKLVRRNMVLENAIRFDETPFSNDIMFSAKIGVCARKIGVSKDIIYCIEDRGGSLTKNKSFRTKMLRKKIYINYRQYLSDQLSNNEKKMLCMGILYQIKLIIDKIQLYFYEKKSGKLL